MTSKRHELVTDPDNFRTLLTGEKTHEVLNKSHDFQLGDEVVFHPSGNEVYIGSYLLMKVTHVTISAEGLSNEVCVLSLKREMWALPNEDAITDT